MLMIENIHGFQEKRGPNQGRDRAARWLHPNSADDRPGTATECGEWCERGAWESPNASVQGPQWGEETEGSLTLEEGGESQG